jgi:transposase
MYIISITSRKKFSLQVGGRLNGEMLQTYIQRAFSISYHQNSIYKLIKSLNITWTPSGSKYLKQSEKAQENFKKTAN